MHTAHHLVRLAIAALALAALALPAAATPPARKPSHAAHPPAAGPARSEAEPALLRGETIHPGLHVLWIDEYQTKALVAEFERYLVVVESPHTEEIARRILAVASARFPGKPVRYLFHTHHHDHSIGSIDPFLDAGATVVTAASNLPEIERRTRDRARLRAQSLVFSDTLTLADDRNALTAYLLRRTSYDVPTPEYILVHFPAQQTLVSGCLYNKPLGYHEVVNLRKPALKKFLVDRALAVQTMVPTNTTRASGFEDLTTPAMLDETLARGLHPDAVADQLAARPVAELRKHEAALAAQFRGKVLRPYDLLVCANTLRFQRKDVERAIVLLEVDALLFPGSHEPRLLLGEILWESGDRTRAEAELARALALAPAGRVRDEVRREIDEIKARP
jgi:glyoxylase-like metal-dependent hydrolase (beta-lactamase superfamily II)